MSYEYGRSGRYHTDTSDEDEYIPDEYEDSDEEEDPDEEFLDDDDADDEDRSDYMGSSKRLRDEHRNRQAIRLLPRKPSSLNWRPRKNGAVSGGTKGSRRPPPKVASQQSLSNFSDQNTRRQVNSRRSVPGSRKLSEPLRQCLGPGCTRVTANPATKYCSKECGLTLALKRLERYFPAARASWYSDPTGLVLDSEADWADRERLKVVRTERNTILKRLYEMESELTDLNQLITRAHQSKSHLTSSEIAASASADKADGESAEPVICVTCSSEVNMRQALRHMDKCFQKTESASLLCSNMREQASKTPLFCDSYDPHAKAYCKRLRSVCEHVRDPKYPADAICGFPLVKDVFTPTDRFCCTPRQKCSLHFGWERKKQANIDMKRYRQLIRNDELLHEESRLLRSLAQRAGILGMILNRTIDEEARRNEGLQ